MRFASYSRASVVGVVLTVVLVLSTITVSANNGRDFSGYFDVSNVQQQGELVQVTLHLQLFNHGDTDAKSVVVTLLDTSPSMILRGSFAPVKVWKHQQRLNLSQEFFVSQREYAEWMAAPGQPNVVILFQDAKGKTWSRGAQISHRPLVR
jgi:hypothetical protein